MGNPGRRRSAVAVLRMPKEEETAAPSTGISSPRRRSAFAVGQPELLGTAIGAETMNRDCRLVRGLERRPKQLGHADRIACDGEALLVTDMKAIAIPWIANEIDRRAKGALRLEKRGRGNASGGEGGAQRTGGSGDQPHPRPSAG